jgi:hypothetical protein
VTTRYEITVLGDVPPSLAAHVGLEQLAPPRRRTVLRGRLRHGPGAALDTAVRLGLRVVGLRRCARGEPTGE